MCGLFHTIPKQTILKFQLLLILRNIKILTLSLGKETGKAQGKGKIG